MKYNGKIIILSSRDHVTIEIEDASSSVTFVELKLTPEQFCAAVGRQGGIPCKMITRALDKVGKFLVVKTEWVEIPFVKDHWKASSAQKKIDKYLEDLYKETEWSPRSNLRSQNSHKEENGKVYVSVTLRAYAEESELDKYRQDPECRVFAYENYWD